MLLVTIIIAVLIIYIVFKMIQKIGTRSTHPFFEFFEKGTSHPVIEKLKLDLGQVCPEIRDMRIVEGDSSYTINKKKIYLCLKDKKNGNLYDKNMLTYVLLHEMAHVLNTGNPDPEEDIGHTDAFHRKFDKLLMRAEKLGLYNASLPLVEDYCK
tara:strand:- start:21433 stop:21894 length:462 start_codon:yes stop_codon:yes gene_type:complete